MKKLISILAIFSMLFSSAISCSFAQDSAEKVQLTSGGEYSFQTKSIENKKTENSDDEKYYSLASILVLLLGASGATGVGTYFYNEAYKESSQYTYLDYARNILTGAGLAAGAYFVGLPLLGLAKTAVVGTAGGLWTGTKFAAGGAVTLCKLPFKIVGGVVNAAIHPISSISYLFTFFSLKNKLYRAAGGGINDAVLNNLLTVVNRNVARGTNLENTLAAVGYNLAGFNVEIINAIKTVIAKEFFGAVWVPARH